VASNASAPFLQIEGLTYRYRRATEPALRDISLDVALGEVLLVAGPSGCGKSTLIRAINGLIPHAYPGEMTGTVRLDGELTTDLKLRDIARHVGTVLQDPAKQIVAATVQAELAFGPENLGLPRADIRRRLDAVAPRAGIGHLLERQTSALSGGERQLLAMAGTLMMEPRLFVVDEPLANLDPDSAARLLALLRTLVDEGAAVVIVEHRVEEALDLRPDRVLYLDDGAVNFLGGVDGFLEVADPGAVKLPFEVTLARARRERSSAPGARSTNGHEPAASPATNGDLPPRLAFRGVRAGYEELEVLRGIDVSLGAREVVAILGPNGSGKTTLFKTAMNLLPVTAGHVEVDGRSITNRPVAQLATVFGYVFQSPSQMLFERTVYEELMFGPRNLGRPESQHERIFNDAIRRTGLDTLEDIRERPPLTLSFGQQKRLALAIALALEPPTLILDEPSAGQDHRTAGRFMAEVMAIPGLESIYLVTHDVDLALTHASRILLFRDGQVVADGPPAQVIEDEDRWRSCNLRPTALMRANAQWRAGREFLDGESLARWLIATEVTARSREGGPSVDAR
jgi:energy-coupling factor transport system ATP-binding protein